MCKIPTANGERTERTLVYTHGALLECPNGPGLQHQFPLNPLTHNRSEVATVAKNADPVGTVLGIHGFLLSKFRGETICRSSSQRVPFHGISSHPKAYYYCLSFFLLVSSCFYLISLFKRCAFGAVSLSLSPLLHFAPPYGFGFRHDMVISMLKCIYYIYLKQRLVSRPYIVNHKYALESCWITNSCDYTIHLLGEKNDATCLSPLDSLTQACTCTHN